MPYRTALPNIPNKGATTAAGVAAVGRAGRRQIRESRAQHGPQSARSCLRWTAVFALILGGLLAVGSVEAYLLFSDGRSDEYPVWSEHARHWSDDVWAPGDTLRYEIVPDPDFEIYFDGPEGAAPFLEQALAAWESIPTADISWRLDGVGEEERSRRDGVNQVFVDETALDDEGDPWCSGYASSWLKRSSPSDPWQKYECDVAFCAGYASIPDSVEPDYLEEYRQRVREGSVYMLVHEFGHCLGLGHAGDLSSTGRWNEFGLQHPGDPAMSYGYSLEHPEHLALDDIVGASLLRPRGRWQRTTGSVSGIVRIEGEPAPYVHIWALPAKENALRDRVGVFSRDDGVFLIEGLDPGEYAFWAQPIASQGANQWVMSRGGLTDLDDTLVGSLVRVRAGRTTENVDISMRRGRALRPPPEEVPPRRERASLTSTGSGPAEVCPGVQVEAERPLPADGPLWFTRRHFSLGRDQWWGTTLTVEWSLQSGSVVLDWAGAYRNWWWTREDDEERADFFAVWEEGGSSQLSARSPRLDVAISDYRIEKTASGVRHTIDMAWPGSTEASLRFRSNDDACDGEPLVVCSLTGCEIRS